MVKTVVKLTPSPRREKKWRVTFGATGRHVDFGAKGYTDFLLSKDPERMKRYVSRHSKMGEHWSDPMTPGFWARWLLWSRPTLAGAKKLIEHKFSIKVR